MSILFLQGMRSYWFVSEIQITGELFAVRRFLDWIVESEPIREIKGFVKITWL
jgi:hypothetical protein